MIKNKVLLQKVAFFGLLLLCFMPFVDAPIALVLGFALAVTLGNPYAAQSSKTTKWLLKVAIVGLGFGMNFYSAINAGKDGLLFTVFSIVFTLLLGWILGKWLGVEKKISYLVSSGTAICGGSAIAAVAPTIDASDRQISVALGTVFILNAIALIVFPWIGHALDLSQQQFGVWSAIAIHDTSSVVGAASKYGEKALEIATTIKLGRALWIIPLSIFTVLINKGGKKKISLPYFIGLFILAMLISTFLPQFGWLYQYVVLLSKKALVITLFLIGSGLSIETIKSVGVKTFLQGVLLWIAISVSVLIVVVKVY